MRRMFPVIFILGLFTLLYQNKVTKAQTVSNSAGISPRSSPVRQDSQLSSQIVGDSFFQIAYELAHAEKVTSAEIEQAIVFLNASKRLDESNKGIRPLLIELYCNVPNTDYSDEVIELLQEYVDKDADLNLSYKALNYILEKQGTRQKRQQVLEKLLLPVGSKNDFIGSDIATKLGLIENEKHNTEIAEKYFLQAYTHNRYNNQAFEQLQKLASDRIPTVLFLQRERIALRENPTNLDTALAFASRAEELQMFETASEAYEYCAQLFDYLYPSTPLDVRIYLPWAISCYNSKQNLVKCLEITERIRAEGNFDFTLESIAGRAAQKMGESKVALEILKNAINKAKDAVKKKGTGNASGAKPVNASQLAWFYCFVVPSPEPNNAPHWANQALTAEPDSSTASALVAYSLIMNNMTEQAKAFISKSEHNQISDLVQAQILFKEGQKTQAIHSLISSIEKDPGSLVAERAKEILEQQGQIYSPQTNPEAIIEAMSGSYGKTLVPPFTRPEKIFTVELVTNVDELTYGEQLEGSVVIKNNSQEALIINDNALLRGNIRVDAVISGDINKDFPLLVNEKIQTSCLIEPGQSMSIPLFLMTGRLIKLLQTYPQASLNIEFTLYIDPVKGRQGEITNRLTYLQSVKTRIRRQAVQLTSQYLQERYATISKNQNNEKIITAGLFIGLLKEINAMSGSTPAYKFMYGDWEPDFLRGTLTYKEGLLRNPVDTEWPVKVYTMAQLLDLPLNYELVEAVSTNLSSEKWPVRMIAVYILAREQKNKFRIVLDSIAKEDKNELVRKIASSLINK
jgi:tetratricopeptide (TPR) repeat protein